MEKLWWTEGLDLRMQIYGVVSTGDNVGMVEVVKNSTTNANINEVLFFVLQDVI